MYRNQINDLKFDNLTTNWKDKNNIPRIDLSRLNKGMVGVQVNKRNYFFN